MNHPIRWWTRIRHSLCLGLTGCIMPVQALEQISMAPYGTAQVTIAQDELTHLTLHPERIAAIHGVSGHYELTAEPKRGDVYLKPVPHHPNPTPFSVFVTTEKGHHLTLRLTPTPQPSDTIHIQLRPPDPSLPTAPPTLPIAQWFAWADSVHQGHVPPDLSPQEPDPNPLVAPPAFPQIQITPMARYTHTTWTLAPYQIHNAGAHPIAWEDTGILDPESCAVICPPAPLLPGHTATIYRITSHAPH